MKLKYNIDDKIKSINIEEKTVFSFGPSICLSKKFGDITRNKNWYKLGYKLVNTKKVFNLIKVKKNIQSLIFNMIYETNKNINKNEFVLENYHKFVDQKLHNKIIKKTRYLEISDFGFKPSTLLNYISNLFKIKLNLRSNGQYDPKIIIRINSPKSMNYNPAHKDIYQIYDKTKNIPKMVNIWIPICGVKEKTGLPIAIGSHLIPENKILRSKAGVKMDGISYNVNCIKSWDKSNQLRTIVPKKNQMLIFSSYLIHGLAQNYNEDETRISLEFRLFNDN